MRPTSTCWCVPRSLCFSFTSSAFSYIIKYFSERHSCVCLMFCCRDDPCFQQLPVSAPTFLLLLTVPRLPSRVDIQGRVRAELGEHVLSQVTGPAVLGGHGEGWVSLQAWAASQAPRCHSCPRSGKQLCWGGGTVSGHVGLHPSAAFPRLIVSCVCSPDSLGWKLFYVTGCLFVAVQNLEDWEVRPAQEGCPGFWAPGLPYSANQSRKKGSRGLMPPHPET